MRLPDFKRSLQKRRGLSLLFLLFSAVLLAACTGSQPEGDPAEAVEAYLDAMVANQTDRIPQLVCPAYESGARTDFDSMGAVGGAALENVDCTRGVANGDNTSVTCTGAITFTYNGENQSLDLTVNNYLAQKVDGEWKMCGYVQ